MAKAFAENWRRDLLPPPMASRLDALLAGATSR
jgi:hypothetical protein